MAKWAPHLIGLLTPAAAAVTLLIGGWWMLAPIILLLGLYPFLDVVAGSSTVHDVEEEGKAEEKEGKEQEIVLNYQNLDQDVLAFQKSITAGSWVGFSLFFLLIMLISWGV